MVNLPEEKMTADMFIPQNREKSQNEKTKDNH